VLLPLLGALCVKDKSRKEGFLTMKPGTKIGLSFSFIGCAVGAYFGLSPVYSQLQSGVLSGLEAGLTFSIAGIFIGSVLATASILSSNKYAT
jgi:hypothetical protein